MAITEVTTLTVDNVTIGLSDTIDNLIQAGEFTIANLQPYMICGQSTVGNIRYGSLSGSDRTFNGNASELPEYYPVTNTGALGPDTVQFKLSENNILANDSYGRNILLHGTINSNEPQSIRSDNMTNSDLRVVTSIDYKKIYYDVELGAQTVSYNSPSGSSVYYATGSQGAIKTSATNQNTSCYVYSVFGTDEDDWYCIKDWMFPCSDSANNAWQFACNQSIRGNYANTGTSLLYGYTNFANNKTMTRVISSSNGDTFATEDYNWTQSGILAAISGDTIAVMDYLNYAGTAVFYLTGLDNALRQIANAGLKFKYNDTWYKPTASGGYITGYTDDMTEESDWDDIEDVTGNTVPVTPPGPTPPGPGYDDDPWSGVSFSGVGVGGAGAFAKCYYMTSTELANLRSWMNSNNVPEGFDPMAQIIGLSQVPVSLSGDDNTTVQFVNSSAVYDPGVTRVVDSGVNTQIAMGTPKRYSLGSVNIVRRMQERGEPYLDYDCQIELYLPLIGVFSLDTQAVMGRTITAEAVLDPISGTLAAYAYVSRDGQNLPIAYGSTTIGVDLPITAQQYSVARAALKQANAQLGTSLLSSTLSLIAAATAGGKGSGTGAKTATGSTNGLAAAGIREAGADYMKASQAGNVFGDFMQWGRTIRQLSYGNNTAVAGSFGGSSAQWSYPFTAYVKIIRPRYEKPSNFAHSQGVPCVQTKKIGNCTGFIQCIGVEVKGITGATDIELQAIQAALTNGVFAGGGS